MRKKRCSVEQIVGILKGAEVGYPSGSWCGKWGFPSRHSSGGRSGTRSWRTVQDELHYRQELGRASGAALGLGWEVALGEDMSRTDFFRH